MNDTSNANKLVSTFRVPGKPVGKQSVQSNSRTKIFYKPKKTGLYEKLVAFHANRCMRESSKTISSDAMRVVININYEITKSYSKQKKADARAGKIRPKKKPDVDNVSKSVHDAMEGIVYENDKQIVESLIIKNYAPEWSIEVEFNEL